MSIRRTLAAATLVAGALQAQDPVRRVETGKPKETPKPRDTVQVLSKVRVEASTNAEDRSNVSKIQLEVLPVSASVTATRARETVNLVDTPDAVKYLPSVFIRKRNNGDTQAVMGTRTWGVSSSARTLVFADGVLLSALIANNNNIGGPRWGLVAPSEIARIDMMYGPYSAAYAGNSMGAVMEITTRMPVKREGSIEQTQANQSFALYGTSRNYGTTQTTAHYGDRLGKFSFRLSGNYQMSNSQPLTYVTAATNPANTTGAFTEKNKLGQAANVLGASGLLNTDMANARIKLAYDFSPAARLSYSLGWWQNDASSNVQSYIANTSGPTYAGAGGFASGYYDLIQQHTSHAASLRGTVRGTLDYEIVGTRYSMDKDEQRFPTTATATGTAFGTAGRAAVLTGTGWQTADARATWRTTGLEMPHIVSVGAHYDTYELVNPTYNTAEWRAGAYGTTATEGRGKTRTQALYIQDKWMLSPSVTFTFGGRFEQWRAFDGYNANGTTKVTQKAVKDEWFSPKAVLSWAPTTAWSATASVGKAVRFATAAELYQLVSTGTTFTSPAPNLRPDNAVSSELRLQRTFTKGMAQVALFQDDVHDAIISQFLPLVNNSSAVFSYLSNVDRVRARGVELVLGTHDLGIKGLELNANGTYNDAKTLRLTGQPSATLPASAAIGKMLPNIPKWRYTVQATYRPAPLPNFGVTIAGRYASKMFTTLDNADVNPNTYQGFSQWFVADARASYRFGTHWHAALGVDNLLNQKYFLFHPFPQRTIVGNLRFAF